MDTQTFLASAGRKDRPRNSGNPKEDGLKPLLWDRLRAWCELVEECLSSEGFIEEVTFALVFDGYAGVF